MVKIRKIRAARVVFWCAQISRLTIKFKILKFLRKNKGRDGYLINICAIGSPVKWKVERNI